jgi:hypothetical protein
MDVSRGGKSSNQASPSPSGLKKIIKMNEKEIHKVLKSEVERDLLKKLFHPEYLGQAC